MKKSKIMLAVLASTMFIGAQAYAATASTTFGVSANILANCEISATDMNFGNVILALGSQSTSTITLICPPGVNGYVRLNEGLHDINFSGQRNVSQVVNGTDAYVGYDLFIDSSRTTRFTPFGSVGFGGVAIAGNGSAETITVYGDIPIQAAQPAGLYTDTIAVRLDY